MIGGARGSDGTGSQGSAPNISVPGGKSWNFYREGGLLWHQWGTENPYDDTQLTTLAGGTAVANINDQLRAQPTIFSRPGTLTNLMILGSLATANDNRIRFSIYKCNADSLYPTDRVWDSGDIVWNTVTSPATGNPGYMISPNLSITDAGVYFFAWTCNANFANNCSLCYVSQANANRVIPWLGVPDRGWSDGFNNAGAATLAAFQRAGCQWAVASFPFAAPPTTFPGTALTTPIADGSTVGLSYAGAQQLKGGGAPIQVLFRFNPA